jgi:hypothetical protein
MDDFVFEGHRIEPLWVNGVHFFLKRDQHGHSPPFRCHRRSNKAIFALHLHVGALANEQNIILNQFCTY